ncbi:hypothetical protein SCOR_32285 [Sulfidibacter corallicola]
MKRRTRFCVENATPRRHANGMSHLRTSSTDGAPIPGSDKSKVSSRSRLFVAFLFSTLPLFATLETRTTVNPITLGWSCEEAGILFFTVTRDDFPHVDPANPVYLKLRLDHGARLGKTLVDMNVPSQGRVNRPIYLPIHFGNQQGGIIERVVAPTDTLSILRWVAGEDTVWLRIQRSTRLWIETGIGIEAPSPGSEVSFLIGISAEESRDRYLEDFENGRSNLPFATREPASTGSDTGNAVSTLCCVDLSQSNLEGLPAQQDLSGLNIRMSAFQDRDVDPTTLANPSQIAGGSLYPLFASHDIFIARGVQGNCTLSPELSPFLSVPVCPGDQSGVVRVQNRYETEIQCDQRRGADRDSRFGFTAPPGAEFGFRVLTDENGQMLDASEISGREGTVLLAPDALRHLSGRFSVPFADLEAGTIRVGDLILARNAEVLYLDYGWVEDITLAITLDVPGNATAGLIDLDVYAVPTVRSDGSQAERECGPSWLEIRDFWRVGHIEICPDPSR